MPRQPDLLPQEGLTIAPAQGRKEPRLWVRRLVIWNDQAQKPIRDVPLRPGLNIVWSPDGADQGANEDRDIIGHGSGKTLFCRLLRYCLGEPRYASEVQRERIAEKMPEGAVGAEVVLNGVVWAVIRPFAPRRRHIAMSNCTLEEAVTRTDDKPSIEPFIEAASTAFFPASVASLVPKGKSLADLWLIVLAWLTRDQECRFHHVLDWRSSDSKSDSPASGLSRSEQLDALRICLTALSADEHTVRAEIAASDDLKRRQEDERDYLVRAIEEERRRLCTALNVADDHSLPGRMALAPLASAAQARFGSVAGAAPAPGDVDINKLRKLLDDAQAELNFVNERKAAVEANIPIVKRLIASIGSEMPGLSHSVADAETPACPVCEVPIDRALAEGCKLSHKIPDLESMKVRREKRRRELDDEKKNLLSLEAEERAFPSQTASGKQVVDRHTTRLQQLEAAREARQAVWYNAKRLIDDVEAYGKLIDRHEAAITSVRNTDEKIKAARSREAAFREKQSIVFSKLGQKFDAIIRELVGSQGRGRVSLTGNGLELTVDHGGDRSTAAIESLKIIALDLAALTVSIEGNALSPEFLLHDSPREADLGLSLYHRIFALARRLEAATKTPLFQYIVTTTTQPPVEFKKAPWLCLELQGSPADQRLLRCDL